MRVALAGIDDDDELADAARTPARDTGSWSRGRDDLAGLPEDALVSRGQRREDELRAVLTWPVEDQVDGHASAPTEGGRNLLDDLSLRRPAALDPGTEYPARPRPGVADLEDQATVDGKPNQVGQTRVRVGVSGNDEVHSESLRSQANIDGGAGTVSRDPAPTRLSKWSYSRQKVVAWSTFVAGGPADEIRTQPEQHEGALGKPWPGLEAAFGSKAAGRRWIEGRQWGDEALASSRAHPTRLTLAVVIR